MVRDKNCGGAAVTTADGQGRIFDTKEAAEFLRQQPQTLCAWRCRRQGPRFLKQSRSVRYLRADLEAWQTANAVDVAGSR